MSKPDIEKQSGLLLGSEPIESVRHRRAYKMSDDDSDKNDLSDGDKGDDDATDSDKGDSDLTDREDSRDTDGKD